MDKVNDSNSIKEVLRALKPFLGKVEDNAIKLSALDNRLLVVMEEQSKLSRILYEGNGQPPLTARMTALETCIEQMKDSLRDQKGEDREAVIHIHKQIEKVGKASSELSIAFEEFQINERGRREAAEAREIVHYSWKLNAFQAVLLLILSSVVGFVGSELSTHWQNFKSMQRGSAPTQQITK